MYPTDRQRSAAAAATVGSVLAILAAVGPIEARGQQPVAPPTGTASTAPGWYSYSPGQGWVLYAPPSGPAVTSAPPAPSTAAGVPPGWMYYSPATGWIGYAPASAPVTPVVTPSRRTEFPPGPARRWAANMVVNHDAAQYIYALSSYREYGSGRNIPLKKPWLPPSP